MVLYNNGTTTQQHDDRQDGDVAVRQRNERGIGFPLGFMKKQERRPVAEEDWRLSNREERNGVGKACYSSTTTLVTWPHLFIGEHLGLNRNRLRMVLANVIKLC